MRWSWRRWRERRPATSVETWRTALHAAYFTGKQGADALAWAAGSRNTALRRTVAYSLFLWWRTDPESVYEVQRDLARRIRGLPVGRSARILRTLADTSISIYINHPEREDVARHTSALWSEVLKGRLRLDRRRWLDVVAFALLASVLSRRVLETALLDQPPRVFFRASPERRAQFRRSIRLIEPGTPISGTEVPDDLAGLLESPVRLHGVLAALVIAVHACREFEVTEPTVRSLFERVGGTGRLWAVQAFSVLLPDTPVAWIPLLEDLTAALLVEDRATFLDREGRWDAEMDLTLLPLGLAYGKAGRGMPLFERLLDRLLGDGDDLLAARVIEALVPVGLHYPTPVFEVLRPLVRHRALDGDVRASLVTTLSTIRTVQFNEVDLFLREVHAPHELRRAVAAGTGAERVQGVHRLFSWVGLYNNAVHQALHYPIMREQVLIGGLEELVRARTPRQFLWSYSWPVLRLVRASDFELIRWTGWDPVHRAGPGGVAT